MSMQLLVLFAMQDAPDIDEWKNALKEQNVPVSITEEVDLGSHAGFLPMRLENKDTGLYFQIEDYADLAAGIPPLKEVSIEDPVVYSLGYGGSLEEGAVAFYSAFAMTVAFNGVAYEPQGGGFMSADSLLEAATQLYELTAN